MLLPYNPCRQELDEFYSIIYSIFGIDIPTELIHKIYNSKFSIELNDYHSWLFSDANKRSPSRIYTLRSRNVLEQGSLYSSALNYFLDSIYKISTEVIENTQKHKIQIDGMKSLLNGIKLYGAWFEMCSILYDTLFQNTIDNWNKKFEGEWSLVRFWISVKNKILEFYDDYIVRYGLEWKGYSDEDAIIMKSYIYDSYIYIEDLLQCIFNQCHCSHSANLLYYYYDFNTWLLDIRILRSGKIIYMSDTMYKNPYLTLEMIQCRLKENNTDIPDNLIYAINYF